MTIDEKEKERWDFACGLVFVHKRLFLSLNEEADFNHEIDRLSTLIQVYRTRTAKPLPVLLMDCDDDEL